MMEWDSAITCSAQPLTQRTAQPGALGALEPEKQLVRLLREEQQQLKQGFGQPLERRRHEMEACKSPRCW